MILEEDVLLGGRRTRCLEAGSGRPVLFLHAFPLHAAMWRPQLEQVPEGWRFIAPDLRGFGPDAAPSEPPTMDDLAGDVCELMDRVKIDQAVICGLSMGGYVAFAAWRRMPERIRGLVLADTRPEADTPDIRDARRAMMTLAGREGTGAVADQMLPRLLGETTRRERPGVVAHVARLIRDNTASAVTGALHALMERGDSSGDLPGIDRPVLVVAGDEDTITPVSVAGEMQRAMPRASLVVLPRAGHLSNLEAPAGFSAALADFLPSTV